MFHPLLVAKPHLKDNFFLAFSANIQLYLYKHTNKLQKKQTTPKKKHKQNKNPKGIAEQLQETALSQQNIGT